MHHPKFLFALFLLVVTMTAFLPGDGQTKSSAEMALSRKAIPVEPLSLLEAVQKGESEVMELLLRAGVDPDARDEVGRTLLMLALHGGRPDLALRLLEAGADGAARDDSGLVIVS